MPRPSEPPKNIWFRRRVSLTRSLVELWAFRELTATLAERDLRVRYKQAALGVAWAVITPVIMMLAFSLIVNKITHTNTGLHHPPYPLWSYMGLLPWTFFSSTVGGGGMSLVSNNTLLNKLYCPREVFPIAGMIDATFDALIAALVLAIMFPALGFAPASTSIYVPLLLIVLVMFTMGVTLAVSVIVVYMRDLRLAIPMVLQFGLFVTPVIYPPTKLSHHPAFLIAYSVINPLVPVIDGMRRCVLSGQPPNWTWLLAGGVSSLVFLVGGFWLFKRLETGIADVA
ncbi:MAG TPA: ABC transporter permease [Solirubrobacteraceae bacterium]|nr:ABC transporter permease [Solirubrobacteraceae bacterium]